MIRTIEQSIKVIYRMSFLAREYREAIHNNLYGADNGPLDRKAYVLSIKHEFGCLGLDDRYMAKFVLLRELTKPYGRFPENPDLAESDEAMRNTMHMIKIAHELMRELEE